MSLVDIGTIATIATAGISLAALVVSIIALVRTWKSSALQDKVNSLESQLKEIELKNKREEQADQSKPKITVSAMKKSQKAYCLRIANISKVMAYNVSTKLIDSSDGIDSLFHNVDIEPYEELASMNSYDYPVFLVSGFPSKFKIRATWEDESGENHQKDFLLSF